MHSMASGWEHKMLFPWSLRNWISLLHPRLDEGESFSLSFSSGGLQGKRMGKFWKAKALWAFIIRLGSLGVGWLVGRIEKKKNNVYVAFEFYWWKLISVRFCVRSPSQRQNRPLLCRAQANTNVGLCINPREFTLQVWPKRADMHPSTICDNENRNPRLSHLFWYGNIEILGPLSRLR